MTSIRPASRADESPLAGFPDPIGAASVTFRAMPLGVPSAAVLNNGVRQRFNAGGRFCRNLVVGNSAPFLQMRLAGNAGSSISLLGFGAETHLVTGRSFERREKEYFAVRPSCP